VSEQQSAEQFRLCDIEAIHQFWDGALRRLKARAELAASGARATNVTNSDSTRRIDGDEKQSDPKRRTKEQ
jgi:hypothetical protein